MAFGEVSNDKLNLKSMSKKQKIILAAAAVLILAGAVVYFNFFQSAPDITEGISSLVDQNLPGESQAVSLDKIMREIDFDAGFLGSSRFQALKIFRDWPLKVEQKGRRNPFSY